MLDNLTVAPSVSSVSFVFFYGRGALKWAHELIWRLNGELC